MIRAADEVKVAILGGAGIAIVVTLAMAALRPAVVLLGFAGLLIALPSLVLKEVKRYWLGVYVISLLFDVSKRLTKDLVHPYELFQKFGLPPSGNLSIHFYVSDVVLFSLVLSWLLRIILRKEKFYFPKIAYIPLAFLCWALFSSLVKSTSLYLSFFELVHLAMYLVAALYIANNIESRALVRGIMFASLFAMVLEATAVIAMFIEPSGADLFAGMYREQKGLAESVDVAYATMPKAGEKTTIRSRGTFAHPGSAALYFQFFLPLTAALLLASRTWRARCLYLLLLALGSVAAVLTFSRSGALGAAAGILWVVWMARKRDFLSKRQYVAILTFGAICVLAATPKVYSFFTSRPEAFTFRFTLIEEGLKTVLENPILGVGLNNSSAAHPDFRIKEEEGGFKRVMAFHNQYLITAVDTGIVGLILFTSFILGIIVKAYQYSKAVDRDVAVYAIAVGGSYLAIAIIMNADPFGGHVHSSLLWLYAGLIMAFQRTDRDRPLPASSA